MNEFGNLISYSRKKKRLTMTKFAQMAGLSVTYVSQIESGYCNPPSRKHVLKIAEILGLEEDLTLVLSGRLPLDIFPIIQRNPLVVLKIIRDLN